MALDLRTKRRRGSESDGEERDMDKKKSPKYPTTPPKVYAFKIRHVCKDCEGILKIMIDEGNIKPLTNASSCPSCGHKSMHQCYYNLCSMCVRVLRRCAMCCADRNVDHIDPRDVILTPTLKAVLEFFPEPYQRILLRFVFKKWEAYLGTQDFPIEEFRHQFMTMAYDFIDDIYMKQSLIQAPNLQDNQIQELINIQRESGYRIADRVVNENVVYQESEDDENMALNISKILRTNQWLQDMVKPLPDETKSKRNLKGSVITGIKSVQQQLIDIRSELEVVVRNPSNKQLNVSPSEPGSGSKSSDPTPSKDKRKETVINVTDDEGSQQRNCKKSENVSAGPSQPSISGRKNPVYIDLTNSETNSEVALDATSSSMVVHETLAAEEARLQLLSQQLEIAIDALKVWDKKDAGNKNTQPSTKSEPVASCSNTEKKNITNINFSDIKISFDKAFYKAGIKPDGQENDPKNESTKENEPKNESTKENETTNTENNAQKDVQDTPDELKKEKPTE